MVTTRSKGSSSFSCRSSAASAPALSSCWPGRMSSFSFSPASSAVAMSGWLSMMCCISGGGGRPHTAGPPRGGRRAAVLRCGRLPACGDNGGSGNGGAAGPRHPRRPSAPRAVPAGRAAPRGSAAPAGSTARHEAGAPELPADGTVAERCPAPRPEPHSSPVPHSSPRAAGGEGAFVTWRLRLSRLPGAGEQNRRLRNSGGSCKSIHAGPSCRKRVPAPPAATRSLRARGRQSMLQRAAGACMGAPVRAERRARGAAGRSGAERMAGARRSFEVLKGTAAAAEREAAARNTLRGPGQHRDRVPAGGTARRHRACAGGAPGARGALRRAGGEGRGGGERAGAAGLRLGRPHRAWQPGAGRRRPWQRGSGRKVGR